MSSPKPVMYLCIHRTAARLCCCIVAFGVVLLLSAPLSAAAQSQPVPTAAQVYAAFDRADFAAALALIQTYLSSNPGDSGMMYNAACAAARLNKPDDAAQWLLRAMKAGFRDFEHMAVDPDLASLHDHPAYKRIMEEAAKASQSKSGSTLDQWLATYDAKSYVVEHDQTRHLTFAAALDGTSLAEMRAMLEKQGDHAVASLFERWPAYPVLIAVPTPDDARLFFKGRSDVGGIYEHAKRRLVARDIGQALRHEFIHLLHFAHMERLNQRHPLWMQEGLASLYETYSIDEHGKFRFLPNDRAVIVKARARSGKLMPWDLLMRSSADEFMAKAAALYPQVRSIFEFLAAKGKLDLWYKVYVESFSDDPTGVSAFELAFGEKLADIEKSWRIWVLSQSDVDMRIDSGDAALGIRSAELLANDGVQVTDVLPNTGAQLAGLRKGDVIVSVNGQSVRSMRELLRFIADKDIGEIIHVRIRRNSRYLELPITLTAAFAGS